MAKKRSGLSSSEVMSHWSRAIDFAKAARFGIDDDRIFGVSFFLGFFIISPSPSGHLGMFFDVFAMMMVNRTQVV